MARRTAGLEGRFGLDLHEFQLLVFRLVLARHDDVACRRLDVPARRVGAARIGAVEQPAVGAGFRTPAAGPRHGMQQPVDVHGCAFHEQPRQSGDEGEGIALPLVERDGHDPRFRHDFLHAVGQDRLRPDLEEDPRPVTHHVADFGHEVDGAHEMLRHRLADGSGIMRLGRSIGVDRE